MSPEERERKRLWMVEYNKRRKSALVDDLNAKYGTHFSLGQYITYKGGNISSVGLTVIY